ncbi:GNAT family N-acetyltransferase [Kribbella sp. ALI-6-A]|uniref:GNAT family N-acetyltransferase n=1 Tax=Kribbella sp. ALI-6-A TaxID=1933817 RepID=UPI00097BECE9|nr:GNAT family N-acetyltransferase [Kribbella sp. ALI-6-A]ONI69279.1 GNAT family N-acetyltransferase [Kribbella sp. ALI-6-A]
MEITSLGYRTDLLLLALGGSEVTDAGDHVVVRTPANPTYWWGNFLLLRSPIEPGELDQRLRDFASTFPDAKHVAFGIDSVDGRAGDEPELTAAGLEIERSTVMTARAVVPPSRPNTTSTYRFLTSDDDWQQLVTLDLAANPTDREGHEEFVRRRVAAHRAVVEAGHGQWFGAFDGDRLQASLGLLTDGSGVARFQNVQTHPDDRGQGIATTLVHRASEYGLGELGAKTLVMVADPEYLAIRIYRALGFEGTQTQVQVTKPAP